MSKEHDTPHRETANPYSTEEELLRAVKSGDEVAWQAFVREYSGYILSAIERRLFGLGDDDVRDVYVDILADLRGNGLRRYDGRSTLKTWLFVVSDRRAIDRLRAKRGRVRDPAGVAGLSAFDAAVFRLFYVDGLSLGGLIAALESKGENVSTGDVSDAVMRIEQAVDPRYLKRLSHDRYARRQHGQRAKDLEYLVRERERHRSLARSAAPDEALIASEVRDISKRVVALRARLDAEQREVLALKFDDGLTAEQVRESLGLRDQRQVYSIIRSATRQLRRWLRNEGYDLDEA